MSFFRTYIDEPIQKELFNRIDSLNFQKTPEGILDSVQSSVQHQFVKSCWARASVVLGKGEVISLNSNLDKNNNPINEPLNIKNGNPYRGKPGITSISTSFKEYFMKQGTINFVVPDPKEFDEFKDNFLKFGRYMLVEFGWSLPYNLELPALDGDTILKISKDIQKRILVGKGNYNALVGVVTNYNFSQTKEGTYEGTIEISSMGRNIFGQKSMSDGKVENLVGYVNQTLAQVKDENLELKEKQKRLFRKLEETFVTFNQVIKALPDVVENYAKDIGKGSYERGTKKVLKNGAGVTTYQKNGTYFVENSENLKVVGQEISTGIVTYDNDKSDDRLALVSWGWFEDFILNSFFSFVTPDETFKTEFLSCTGNVDENTLQNTICNNSNELYSLGFDSIILPGQTKKFDEVTASERGRNQFLLKELINDTNDRLPQFETQVEGKYRGQIRNMYFNVNYLMESFKESKNIELSIQEFWQKVSNDYGGFWRFSIVENETSDGRIMVTDMNVGKIDDTNVQEQLSSKQDPTKIFKFPVYSKDSIVSEQTLTTSNTSEMATLAVYGSNVDLSKTSADDGKGYTALAMRALSMLDNTFEPGEKKETKEKNLESKKYDNILNNISSPVLGNFTKQDGKYIGSSAEYDKEGKIIEGTKRVDRGISFKNTRELIKDDKNIVQDLIDSVSKKFNSFLGKIGDKLEEREEVRRELEAEAQAELRSSFYWFSPEDKTVQIYSSARLTMINEFKRTMLYRINKAPGVESNFSSVLPAVPLQVSLTLQGIGGIKVGDLFYLNYLPKKYKDFCHFMVVNVEHEISTTGWTTKLDSRMIVDVPKLIDAGYGGDQRDVISEILVKESIDKEKNRVLKEASNEALETNINNTGYLSDNEKYFWSRYLTGKGFDGDA